MIFGSVCSGIEAASVAWNPIGWRSAWLAEIEPFPSVVLAHHYPDVQNLGDMTKLADMVANDKIVAPDLLVGGTPCQAFSVAGARKGLADERGFLTIKFVELADEIDRKRAANDNQPAVVVWENVPGVLSDKSNAFGAFLGFLAGEDCELQPPGGKWASSGCVLRGKRAIAWRILDAQYFGVAQRRRRVFVVASARKDFDPAAVLFESEGVRRDTPPSREQGKAVAALTANGVGVSGADDNQGQAGHLIPDGFDENGLQRIVGTLCADTHPGAHSGQDAYTGRLVPQAAPLDQDIFGTLTAGFGKLGAPEVDAYTVIPAYSIHGTQDPIVANDMAHCLGRNSGQENAVAFSAKDYGADATEELSPTLRAGNSNSANQNSGSWMGVQHGMQVRRLTPTECERLQGFPDGYTLVPVGKKMAADGPRYKALGNSMAVPCMAWIGLRIQMQLIKAANDNKKLQGASCL